MRLLLVLALSSICALTFGAFAVQAQNYPRDDQMLPPNYDDRGPPPGYDDRGPPRAGDEDYYREHHRHYDEDDDDDRHREREHRRHEMDEDGDRPPPRMICIIRPPPGVPIPGINCDTPPGPPGSRCHCSGAPFEGRREIAR